MQEELRQGAETATEARSETAASPAESASLPIGKTLDDLRVGESGKVVAIHGTGALRRRIMDMGVTKGTDVLVRKVAPLGDPLQISLRGFEMAIRRADAALIEIA